MLLMDRLVRVAKAWLASFKTGSSSYWVHRCPVPPQFCPAAQCVLVHIASICPTDTALPHSCGLLKRAPAHTHSVLAFRRLSFHVLTFTS